MTPIESQKPDVGMNHANHNAGAKYSTNETLRIAAIVSGVILALMIVIMIGIVIIRFLKDIGLLNPRFSGWLERRFSRSSREYELSTIF